MRGLVVNKLKSELKKFQGELEKLEAEIFVLNSELAEEKYTPKKLTEIGEKLMRQINFEMIEKKLAKKKKLARLLTSCRIKKLKWFLSR